MSTSQWDYLKDPLVWAGIPCAIATIYVTHHQLNPLQRRVDALRKNLKRGTLFPPITPEILRKCPTWPPYQEVLDLLEVALKE